MIPGGSPAPVAVAQLSDVRLHRVFMKVVIIGLFIVGLVMMSFGGFLSTRCLYSPQTELHFTDFLILAVGCIMAVVAVFLHSRIKAGGRIFEITKQDRKEIQDFRTEFSPRNFLARFLVTFGVLFVLVGFASGFHNLLASPKTWTAWLVDLSVVGLGVLCLFSAVALAKKR